MDRKTILILISASVCLLYVLTTLIFRLYKNRYLRSKKFTELNRMTDDITDEYDTIINMSYQLKRAVYSDFSPSMLNQDQMIGDKELSIKDFIEMPPHAYLCTKEIIDKFEHCPYDILKEYCGFSSSDNVLCYIEKMYTQARNLEKAVIEFKEEHRKQLGIVWKSAPLLIKLFSKNQLLLLLGLHVEKGWEDNLYPKYMFVDIEDFNRKIRIVLTPDVIREIIDHLSV